MRQKNNTVLTFGLRISFTDHLAELPAMFCSVDVCRACVFFLLGTLSHHPTRSKVQEFLYSTDTDFFIMQQVPQTMKPFDIIF